MQTERETAVIRPTCAGDVAAMADLFGQLGYPVSPQELEDRWLMPDPAREVLVACLDERIAGVLVWHWLNPLHVAPAWGLISALVVDEGARGSGVGGRPAGRGREPCTGAGVQPAGALQQPQAGRGPSLLSGAGVCRASETVCENSLISKRSLRVLVSLTKCVWWCVPAR